MYTIKINFPFDCSVVNAGTDKDKAMEMYQDYVDNCYDFDEDVTSIVLWYAGDVVAFYRPKYQYA
jgi:hypothetical protein